MFKKLFIVVVALCFVPFKRQTISTCQEVEIISQFKKWGTDI